MRYSVIHQRPGLHCSSLVYDVRKRIGWTALRSLRSIAGEVCQACPSGLAGQRPQDPHTKNGEAAGR